MPVQNEQPYMLVQGEKVGNLNISAIFNSSVDLQVLVDCIRQLINSLSFNSFNSYVNDGFDNFDSFDSFGSSDMIVGSRSSSSSSSSCS